MILLGVYSRFLRLPELPQMFETARNFHIEQISGLLTIVQIFDNGAVNVV